MGRRSPVLGNPKKNSLIGTSHTETCNDPFLNFWFSFVIPHKSRLETGLGEEVWKEIKPHCRQYVSGEWETQCRMHSAFAEIAGKRFLPASRWYGTGNDRKEMELDLVADSVDGSPILIGGVKWSEKTDPLSVAHDLSEKIGRFPFPHNKTIIPVLFLPAKPPGYSGKTTIIEASDICRSRQ